MVVIVLEKCPIALRGDLTKWLQEISVGVYVGQVSARVRDKLWERVCSEAKGGRATMVYSARNEQHLDFRVHNSMWEPIDFDGLKLMLRPSVSRLKSKSGGEKRGYGNTHCRSVRRRHARRAQGEPDEYVVVDVETTGLDCEIDQILEIGAIKIINGREAAVFQCKNSDVAAAPPEVEKLTGIDQEELANGMPLVQMMEEFTDFVGYMPLVFHNALFDFSFITCAIDDSELDELENQCFDTLELARKGLPRIRDHSLTALCEYFEIGTEGAHRALADCRMTRELFVRLLDVVQPAK